jgi:hypothetical protein
MFISPKLTENQILSWRRLILAYDSERRSASRADLENQHLMLTVMARILIDEADSAFSELRRLERIKIRLCDFIQILIASEEKLHSKLRAYEALARSEVGGVRGDII